jgi:phenylacetate-coenzyme A ligase PaaK-like adenylate-forming protein
MSDTDFSLLDVPRKAPIDQADEYLRAAMAWHFGAQTGSAFWLGKLNELDFDPLIDVTTFEDLWRFPNIASELRDAAVPDLIPRGYGSPAPIPRVTETGGTTGAPKRVVQTPDWEEQSAQWAVEEFEAGGYARGRGLLGIVPAGPHGIGSIALLAAARLESIFYTVDLDPRWVKKLTARKAQDESSAYVEHILEQAGYILRTQDIGNVFTTPPIVAAIARNDDMIKLINDKVRYVALGGTQVDPDTYLLLRDIFPDLALTSIYGNTMIMGMMKTRISQPEDGVFVHDPRSPYMVFKVVDPATGKVVPYGDRGQVMISFVGKSMFMPSNLERDTAIRCPGLPGQIGDSISAVRPVSSFDGQEVTEGVY